MVDVEELGKTQVIQDSIFRIRLCKEDVLTDEDLMILQSRSVQ